ncbi:MAG: hypothetical protein ACTSWG_13115 [Candidatus Helarchaeota archaeon]
MSKYDKSKPITIDNCLFSAYLIGSMEEPAKNDGGVGWRQQLTPELHARGISVFDPTREEVAKVGCPTDEFLEKLIGWQKSGNWKAFVENMRKIWRGHSYVHIDDVTKSTQSIHIFGDIDYVEHSKFLVWNLDEGDKPGGTIIELAIAWYRGIPVYLITDIPKTKINKSILYFILDSGREQGAIFRNQTQFLDYIDETYQLKRMDK